MVLFETLTGLGESIIGFLPNIAMAVVLLAIGIVIGWAVGKFSKKVLEKLKIDKYIAGGGKPLFRLSNILPIVFSWFIYLAFIQAAVETLGIQALVAVVGLIINFLPGLIGAVLVVVAGYAVAEYVRRQVEESGFAYSDLIGKILFFLVIYISIAVALPLIKIDATLINNILLVIIGSAGAGMAIALGLGLKDTVAEIAKKYRKKILSGKR